MRACEPVESGYVERDGVRTYYEIFGQGSPTVLLMPTWSIVNSRLWKGQVPFLARHGRVLTFDGRGNGRSDRPPGPENYADMEYVNDAIAVLDATGTERAVVVGASQAGWWISVLAAEHPDRVLGIVLIGPVCPLAPPLPLFQTFADPLDADADGPKLNRHYWRRDYRGFLEFFFPHLYPEPHSTKQLEDSVGWALETTPEILIDTVLAPSRHWERAEEVYAAVRCPVLVIQGTEDGVVPHDDHGVRTADALGASMVSIEGGGHAPEARDPVKFNLVLQAFVDSVAPPPPRRTRWTRAMARPKRALYVSSPIGLGHAQRDLAIAQELRALHPELRIDWLAQHPVTAVLDAAGEHIHPASALLSSEAAHVESESCEHDLHAFQAYRRMDEILVANFMVFHDLVTEHYDLVIGDEAWDIDYFLHENPELKRFEFCWLTDFVGWLPMPEGGEREACVAADYNAQMIEHVARFSRVRGRSIFVGKPDDLVPNRLGPDLPTVREWTEANFDFSGYVTGFDPDKFADREALRAHLGYGTDERVCLVTVGGTAVGSHLLRRIIAAYPAAKRRVPGLRMVVVAGPRIDPSSLPSRQGLEIRPFVPQLYHHLAACDVAVVQGGLTTTMELTATGRPFLFFPLRRHFEQQFHVRHRLARYGAGRCMDYESSTPDSIADAISEEIDRKVNYRPVERDGATRAAALIADLL